MKAFDQLQQHVATSALHESAELAFACSCFPNTRKTLLDSIIRDIGCATLPQEAEKIMWINGAAGSGKTSIAHSVVERCVDRGVIVATFFFDRLDSARNTIDSVVPTIAYQLCQQVPIAKLIIIHTILNDPLIFKKSFDIQFQRLVMEPLRHIGQTMRFLNAAWSSLLLFDGIDECPGMAPHQTLLIRTIATHVRSITLPLTVLFTSRPELHLSMQFASESNLVRQVALDTNYPANDDIRLYLLAKFDAIKTTHPFREDIVRSGDWPSIEDVEKIVDNGSGQFVYAAIVMNFVSDPDSYPPHQLKIALSQESCSSSTPSAWKALDSMYHYIFSQLKDLPQAMLLVSFVILAEIVSIPVMSSFFDISIPSIRTTLGGLASVINCQEDNLVLLHASLPDFLLDEARSGAYHINPKEWKARLCIISLRRFAAHSKDWDSMIFLELFSGSQGCPELRDCISNFNPCVDRCSPEFRSEYIKILERMDLSDEGEMYKRHRELVTLGERQAQQTAKNMYQSPSGSDSGSDQRTRIKYYFCLYDGCGEIFATKYSLQVHHSQVHALEEHICYIVKPAPTKPPRTLFATSNAPSQPMARLVLDPESGGFCRGPHRLPTFADMAPNAAPRFPAHSTTLYTLPKAAGGKPAFGSPFTKRY
ncbi:hypothetical protein HYPSUDRAFT_214655 [Hypholoma sublateritium FD-334 SS-4]|uniref:C2H2-type domain-containing protein n=1 Tax=Hypholoma sublateritium (strain FD-334 SS-4) TaxID=945553 RepID=A0A0D2NZX1_HYPSF|nr:hypothetical protein HYPSUDRAFT_214655 [Hypholoma sublateritium FD-334 SS-4]